MPKNPQNSQPATKADLNLVKKDTNSIKGDIRMLKDDVKSDVRRLDKKIDDNQKRIENKLDKLQNTLDGFVGRVDDLTIENRVGTNQIGELREEVESHKTRIKILESSQRQ